MEEDTSLTMYCTANTMEFRQKVPPQERYIYD